MSQPAKSLIFRLALHAIESVQYYMHEKKAKYN